MFGALRGSIGSLFVLFFKLFKVFKSLKVLLFGATLATYSYVFTWQFAVAIMWAIAVHEMGHVWGMRKMGIKTPGFYFIPFFGGVAISDRAKSEWENVFISAMGPVWGILSAVPPAFMYFVTGEPLWASICGFIALINLFNLLPIYPLDGGRIIRSIFVSAGKSAQLVYLIIAAGILVALSFYMQIFLVAVLFALGMFEIYMESRHVAAGNLLEKTPLNRDGYILTGLWYLVLVLVFIGMIFAIRDIEGADLALRILRS